MIMLISPTTTMEFNKDIILENQTTPHFIEEANYLMNILKTLDEESVSKLMNLSSDLTSLNMDRYKNYGNINNPKSQSILAFNGEVFSCMDVSDFNSDDFDFANHHLKILSGLYGVLSPTDMIEPYRLEMKSKLSNNSGNDLYKFWKEKITTNLVESLNIDENPVLINLASSEYIKAINLKTIKNDFKYIDITFKDYNEKSQSYKVLGLYSKKARGYMVRYVIKNRINNIEKLKEFNDFGYTYNHDLSSENELVFTR